LVSGRTEANLLDRLGILRVNILQVRTHKVLGPVLIDHRVEVAISVARISIIAVLGSGYHHLRVLLPHTVLIDRNYGLFVVFKMLLFGALDVGVPYSAATGSFQLFIGFVGADGGRGLELSAVVGDPLALVGVSALLLRLSCKSSVK